MLELNRLLLLLGLFVGICASAHLQGQTVVTGPFARRDVAIPDSGEVRVVAAPRHADRYLWSNGWQTPTIFVVDTGWYWVDAWVDSTVTRDSIHFYPGPPCFHIPSALSPNSEMYDCISLASTCELDTMHFRVFDRWGREVFATSDPDDCWNAEAEERPLPEGVYFYVLDWAIPGGYLRHRRGHVTIVR
jgi:gliding motility-associated-like protein